MLGPKITLVKYVHLYCFRCHYFIFVTKVLIRVQRWRLASMFRSRYFSVLCVSLFTTSLWRVHESYWIKHGRIWNHIVGGIEWMGIMLLTFVVFGASARLACFVTCFSQEILVALLEIGLLLGVRWQLQKYVDIYIYILIFVDFSSSHWSDMAGRIPAAGYLRSCHDVQGVQTRGIPPAILCLFLERPGCSNSSVDNDAPGNSTN